MDYNTRTGEETHIGSIRVASEKTTMAPPVNFSEYWGEQVDCDNVPVSEVLFTQPAANLVKPKQYQFYSSFASSKRANCTGGEVVVYDDGQTLNERIQAAAEDGQKVMLTVATAPSAFRASGIPWKMEERVAPQYEDAFVDRIRTFVKNQPLIKYVQVWNEQF